MRAENALGARLGGVAGAGTGSHVLADLRAHWRGSLPRGRRAGLPVLAAAVLNLGGPAAALRRTAARLDQLVPGWRELLAREVCARPRADDEAVPLACSLLGLRPLNHPGPVLETLARPEVGEGRRFWLLVALAGTDTARCRQVWRSELRHWRRGTAGARSISWLALVRGLLGGWVTWEDFRQAVTAGGLLAEAAGRGSYRAQLEAAGLWHNPTFAKWYRRAVYECSHQPDVELSFEVGGWIRDFPGAAYLWDGLRLIEGRPTSWWGLSLVRWASEVNEGGDEAGARLRALSPRSLCLLSVLRPEFAGAVGEVLQAPAHSAVMRWLLEAGTEQGPDLGWVREVVGGWTLTVGAAFLEAVGALCAVALPPDYWGPVGHEMQARRKFLQEHLGLPMGRLMDKLCYVYALSQRHLPLLRREAARGRVAAIRALALWREEARESLPVLLRLARHGAPRSRAAARESLEFLARGFGVGKGAGDDVRGAMQRRLDLAVAWQDGGLEGRSARVWWDIKGYRVRLVVSEGEVKVRAYSERGPLATIPPVVRRDPGWLEVKQAAADLRQAGRYFRARLEEMMAGELTWEAGELSLLVWNPVVRSLVARTVLKVGEREMLGEELVGSPEEDSPGHQPVRDLASADRVAVAHPVTLMASGTLGRWQAEIVARRLAQPFKQVFREVYLPSRDEAQARECHRFSGHPLEPRRAFAILKGRGYAPGTGVAVKEWEGRGICARLRWAAPGEPVGRLLGRGGGVVTSGPVWFEDAAGRPLRLGQVPLVVFSETLRDADLLVSRAGAGEHGFTSEETRQLRGALVRHTAQALGLTSILVSEDCAWAIVQGKLATYRVHLGSGSVLIEETHQGLAPVDLLDLAPWGEALGGMVDRAGWLGDGVDERTGMIVATVVALACDHLLIEPWLEGRCLGE